MRDKLLGILLAFVVAALAVTSVGTAATALGAQRAAHKASTAATATALAAKDASAAAEQAKRLAETVSSWRMDRAHEAPPSVGPLLGPGFSDSFTVTCATTATAITAASGSQQAYMCQNWAATEVFVGDSGLTTTSAPKFCSGGCPSAQWDGHLKTEYCLVAAGTVTIYCRALVERHAAP